MIKLWKHPTDGYWCITNGKKIVINRDDPRIPDYVYYDILYYANGSVGEGVAVTYSEFKELEPASKLDRIKWQLKFN